MIDPDLLANARYSADQLQLSMYGASGRTFSFAEEKERIRKFEEELYPGVGTVAFPNKIDFKATQPLNVQNLIHDSSTDFKHLVPENQPAVKADLVGSDEDSEERANLWKALHLGYWVADDGERMIPEMVLHLIGGGAIYLLSSTSPHVAECDGYYGCADPDEHSDYPIHALLHPRGAYPRWGRRALIDMMFTSRMSAEEVQATWPETGVRADPKKNDWYEILDYWTRDEIYKCIWKTTGSKPDGAAMIVDYAPNLIHRVPVSAWKDASVSGITEGMFDQAEGMMNYQNTLRTLAVQAAMLNVMQPTVERGVEVFEEGPLGRIRLGNDPNAMFQLVGNREVSQSTVLLDNLAERGQRGTVFLPESREGRASQSIISGAGVEAFAGKGNSLVWHIQRGIARVRSQACDIDRSLDVHYLDYDKPMVLGSGTRRTYKPSNVFLTKGSRYRMHVEYAGGGASPQNMTIQNFQKMGLGVMDRMTFLEQDPNVTNPAEVNRRVLEDKFENVVFQVLVAASTPESVISMWEKNRNGVPLFEAAKELVSAQAQAAQAAQPGGPGAENVIPFPDQPGQAAAQAQGLEKGAVPGGPAPSLKPQFAPQPLPNLLITNPR